MIFTLDNKCILLPLHNSIETPFCFFCRGLYHSTGHERWVIQKRAKKMKEVYFLLLLHCLLGRERRGVAGVKNRLVR